MSAVRGASTGGTSNSWPPILSWKTSASPEFSSTMRCLARRRAPVILTPSSRRPNSVAEGCSTSAGSSTSAASTVEPTTSSRRSPFMVSTSGSSGMVYLYPLQRSLFSPLPHACLARDERRVALRQEIAVVSAHRPDLEACPAKPARDLRRLVQPHAVDLL